MVAKILVVGSINMDLVVRPPRLPLPGETILAGSFDTSPGGKGANQATAAALLGGPVAMIGRVGLDGFGDEMLAGMASSGIDTGGIQPTPDAPTGVALITVDDRAENTIVVASGANMRLTPEDVAAREDLFEQAALLVLQLETPVPSSLKAIELAHKHGMKVVLNPAPAQKLDAGMLRQIDYLIPNEGELMGLTGESSLEAGIRKAREIGVSTLVVTMGEQGALLVDESGEQMVPAFRVVPVDTVAAGDAFVGAFTVALSEGKTTREAARWACAAAAIAVTRKGAQPSLPKRAEVEAFLSESRPG